MFRSKVLRLAAIPVALTAIAAVIAIEAPASQARSSGPARSAWTGDRYNVAGSRLSSHSYRSARPAVDTDGYVKPGKALEYDMWAGGKEKVVPWAGSRVAILVPVSESSSLSDKVMTEVLDSLDGAWSEYGVITGQEPSPYITYDGLDSIALVPKTSCGGAACSNLGATGTEILTSYFQTLYNGVKKSNQYDQALFYEFGRNFWFYGNQLAGTSETTYGDTVTTGFAVLMRFISMNATDVPGGPFDGTAFADFESQDLALVYIYDSDLSDTFANTLGAGLSPGMYGGTDFFASIVDLLTRYGGECFLQRFLADAEAEPSADSVDAAVTNFVNAASKAAGVNLDTFFYKYWGFPKTDGTTLPRVANGIANLPMLGATPAC
jgi:hypothetical protein